MPVVSVIKAIDDLADSIQKLWLFLHVHRFTLIKTRGIKDMNSRLLEMIQCLFDGMQPIAKIASKRNIDFLFPFRV